MSYKWKPSKSSKVEFAKKMQEIDKFCDDNNIIASSSNDSYYFELNGQKYRVSNHTIEASNKKAYNEYGEQVREKYHEEKRKDDVIYIHASKIRIIDIYNKLKDGYVLDGNGNVKMTPQKLKDQKYEKLWEELEDVPFIENKDKELVLDGKFLDFEKGTPVEEIWHFFDEKHSKGVGYLMNEYKTNNMEETQKKVETIYEKVITDGLKDTWSGNYVIDLKQLKLNSKEENLFINMLNSDSRINDIEFNPKTKEADIMFYLDYGPNAEEDEEEEI